jgi:hypothetical protein
MSDKTGTTIDQTGKSGIADSQGSAPRGNVSLQIAAERRAERLRAELRANLGRRKQQSRARREGAEDDRPGTLLGDGDAPASGD